MTITASRSRTTTLSRVLLPALVLASLGCATPVRLPSEATADTSRVSVTFVRPERFTDVKDGVLGSERGAADRLTELDRFLRATAEGRLPPGYRLEVRITDVDLAGEFEPWRGPELDRVRIMRDIYPPRIELDVRLIGEDGRVVQEGHRSLRDLLYLTRTAVGDDDRLRYDKALLRDWLDRELRVRVSRP